MSSQVTGVGTSNEGDFGANEWLVDELYEMFKVDKTSVDKAWWPTLEAYRPVDVNEATNASPAESPAAPEPAKPAAARREPAKPAAARRESARVESAYVDKAARAERLATPRGARRETHVVWFSNA